MSLYLIGFTAILSVADCINTKLLHAAAAEEEVLVMAITDADCARPPGEWSETILYRFKRNNSKASLFSKFLTGDAGVLSVPIIEPGLEMAQVLLDMRTGKGLDWRSANIIHDDTLSIHNAILVIIIDNLEAYTC